MTRRGSWGKTSQAPRPTNGAQLAEHNGEARSNPPSNRRADAPATHTRQPTDREHEASKQPRNQASAHHTSTTHTHRRLVVYAATVHIRARHTSRIKHSESKGAEGGGGKKRIVCVMVGMGGGCEACILPLRAVLKLTLLERAVLATTEMRLRLALSSWLVLRLRLARCDG
jgi:hypothetical protein